MAALLVFGNCGCTSIVAEAVESPENKITTVAVGKIDAGESDQERIARRFRRSLVEGLQNTAAFRHVLSSVPSTLSDDAVLVTGQFLDIDDGWESLRFLIGYGIGSPTLRARFEIRDPSDKVLASFVEDTRSLDGTGYAAHWNPIDMDELADGFAVDAAEAIARWSRGEELNLSIW
jgi:hypothetical protein